ncbi:DNA-directed RNA polymerase III subunit RPC7 [Fusarium oxysporum f. sp. albedinis]|nr:DNA-directed RNA polymerase III subunit RPC7 [Fusarium oxysporum f. sp. albedinis]
MPSTSTSLRPLCFITLNRTWSLARHDATCTLLLLGPFSFLREYQALCTSMRNTNHKHAQLAMACCHFFTNTPRFFLPFCFRPSPQWWEMVPVDAS